MSQLPLILRPSLARRVSITLLLASVVIWAVLMAYYYWQETSPSATQARQQERGELVLSVLSGVDQDDAARDAARWYAALFNAPYRSAGLPDKFVLQLQHRNGPVLFSSSPASALHLQVNDAAWVEHAWQGELYQVYRLESGPWVLHLGQPALNRRWLLARLSSNLTVSVFISFPLLLLPIWFAVTRGMRPLRTLSNLIARRGPDDLSPLQLEVKDAELVPLARALDRLLQQLRTKLSREHGFVQDAAHELRTPLAVIAAQAHVMMMAEAPEQRRAAAQQLEDAIARASHLIRQLLELARIDNGEPQPDELLDLCQVARQAMAEMAPLAMQRQIELELDAPDALVRHIDRHAFLSILHNLLANAVQYSHKQGQVLVALAATDKAIVLSVADDGPGIAEDQRTLVFERFYRVPGSASPGSGLGLPIVAQAVAGLHGSVRLENGLNGRGCRFTVELPLE